MTADRQTFADNGYTITLASPTKLLARPDVVQEWLELAGTSDNLYAFYQSPLWWQYTLQSSLTDYVLRLKDAQQATMLEIRDRADRLVCLTGLYRDECGLFFCYKERVLFKKRIPVVRVAGGAPLLLLQQPEVIALFTKAALTAFPDCTALYIPWLPTNSPLFTTIVGLDARQLGATAYLPHRDYGTHYSITLAATFDDYLAKLSHKTRYQARKALKKLREYGDNQLELLRIERADQIPQFLAAATAVSHSSWQHTTLGPQMECSYEEIERFTAFARQGVLRCYLLLCKGNAVAYVRGFQFGGVYYYSRTGFDVALTSYGPGKVLMLLLLEDLHNHNPPHFFNFQEGDYEYKRHFATDYSLKTDLLLVRSDWQGGSRNKLAINLHRVYQHSLRWLKKLTTPDASASE